MHYSSTVEAPRDAIDRSREACVAEGGLPCLTTKKRPRVTSHNNRRDRRTDAVWCWPRPSVRSLARAAARAHGARRASAALARALDLVAGQYGRPPRLRARGALARDRGPLAPSQRPSVRRGVRQVRRNGVAGGGSARARARTHTTTTTRGRGIHSTTFEGNLQSHLSLSLSRSFHVECKCIEALARRRVVTCRVSVCAPPPRRGFWRRSIAALPRTTTTAATAATAAPAAPPASTRTTNPSHHIASHRITSAALLSTPFRRSRRPHRRCHSHRPLTRRRLA